MCVAINVICGGEGQTFCDAIFHLPANNKFACTYIHVHTCTYMYVHCVHIMYILINCFCLYRGDFVSCSFTIL